MSVPPFHTLQKTNSFIYEIIRGSAASVEARATLCKMVEPLIFCAGQNWHVPHLSHRSNFAAEWRIEFRSRGFSFLTCLNKVFPLHNN